MIYLSFSSPADTMAGWQARGVRASDRRTGHREANGGRGVEQRRHRQEGRHRGLRRPGPYKGHRLPPKCRWLLPSRWPLSCCRPPPSFGTPPLAALPEPHRPPHVGPFPSRRPLCPDPCLDPPVPGAPLPVGGLGSTPLCFAPKTWF